MKLQGFSPWARLAGSSDGQRQHFDG